MQIQIIHTNDIHSHFDAYPKIAAFLEKLDTAAVPTTLVDIGDNMDRFHPITEATDGKVNTTLLNKLNYEFATLGNNEGITLNYHALSTLYEHANFAVLVANLFEKDGTYPDWVTPFSFKTINGVTIGFIGITVFYETFYELLGWKLEDPFVILEKYLPEVKKEADIVVVLSHLGISDDEELARRFPDIDIILGGHTHHVLPEGRVIGNTLLCGAGKHGQYIGRVGLTFDIQQRKLVNKEAELHALENGESSLLVEEYIQQIQMESSRILQKKITVITEPLEIRWFETSPFANLLAEALKDWCDADIGMVNAGVLLDSLDAGEVTRAMLHRICPHPINPCRVMLTGEELREVIQQSLQPEIEQLRVKGLGFRGRVMGKMAFSGVELETENFSDGSVQITAIKIAGRLVDPDDTIVVGTIDMFTFGGLYPSIMRAAEKKFFMPELLRDVLADKLARL